MTALAAAAVLALAAVAAVPGSRAAILRFLHLRGVSVEVVDALPPAQERPLAAGLGPVVSARTAAAVLGGGPLLPPLDPPPPLHLSGSVVSVLFRDRGEPVLLSELHAGGGAVLEKLVGAGTAVTRVRIGGEPGLWLAGDEHVFLAPAAPPRLAGRVLVWQHGDLTLRLEGRGLTLARARQLARSLR
ncbi:MAG TPA: hypothetical protein VFJ77_10235 [Gaiellaceae bacterium]|nr:hypothetical protein [Gaiellaceae bacterium]